MSIIKNEQLQPRLKMTQAEFDEFTDLATYSKLIGVINHLYDEHIEKYPLLFKRFCGDNEIKLAVLWASFDPNNPEKTIEVVPDKKWFVRSKEADEDGDWLFLSNISKDKFNDRYCYSRDKICIFESQITSCFAIRICRRK